MLILYLAAAAAALVWGAVLIQRTGLLGGCLGVVLLASCFGNEFYELSLGPLPITSDRVALLALGIFYVMWAIQARGKFPWLDRVDMLLAAFLLMLTVNTFLHDWHINGTRPVARLLFLNLVPAAVFWLARDSRISEARLRMFCWFFALFALYLGVTAIGEVKQITGIVFPRYILTSPYQEWIGRARGPFINPVTNGLFLSAGLFACTVLWPKSKPVVRVLLAGLMLAALVGTYCTLTRSCWMGAVCGLALIVLVRVPKQWRLPLVVAGLALGAVLFAAKGNALSAFKRDKAVSEFHMQQSAKLRPMLATIAWKIVKDYPFFGCGFGQYKQVDRKYFSQRDTEISVEAAKRFVQHNVFLSLVTETGLVGLALYLLIVGGWSKHAWRLASDPELSITIRSFGAAFLALVVNWVANGMFHDTSLMVNANLLFFLFAGVVQGLHAQAYQVSGKRGMAPSNRDEQWQPYQNVSPVI